MTRIDRRLVLAGEMALAGVLGFVALGHRSFWLDESISVTLAKLDWGAFAHEVHVREANMSLYYLLLRGWTTIGDSEVGVRSLSVVAAILTVPVAYLLVKRLTDTRAALVAGLLIAVNPMLVHYAQEARGYALLVLLVTLGTYLFVRGLAEPRWWIWIAYAVVMAGSAYVHFFGLFVPPAHALSLLFVRPDRVPWRKALAAALLLVSLLAFYVYLVSSVDPSHGQWTAWNRIGLQFARVHDNRPLAAALLVLGVVVALASWLLARRRFGLRLQDQVVWPWALVLLWIAVPVAAVTAIAIVYRPMFVVRYFIVCVPAILILASMLLVRLRRAWLLTAAIALIVIVSLAGVVRWYTGGQVEDWRHATRYVVRSAVPGDGVLLYAPYVRIPFALYLDEREEPDLLPQPVFPAGGWDTPPIRFNRAITIRAGDIESAARRFGRISLVLSHVALFGQADDRYRAILQGLAAAGFEKTSEKDFAGIRVQRYEPAR